MFNPDSPIKHISDDELNRKEFSRVIGNAILKSRTNESLVIGILGKWGSGKTSIVYMTLEHIDYSSNESEKKPIIVWFNPWNYSEQNQLIYQFFNKLSIDLQMPRNSAKLKKAGNKLKTLGKAVCLGTIIPQVGPAALVGSEALKSSGEAAESLGNLLDKDINKLKEEISGYLEKQDRKIIIVIDDIDRLNDREIRQVFQLVKSLADFPKTVYILTFDRDVVIKAIDIDNRGNGDEYLEKIVQIPIEIPLITKTEIETKLKNHIKEFCRDITEDEYNKVHWGNVYRSGFKFFFKNIRDLNRYFNVLKFYSELIIDEVNITDFCAITALQVFAPKVYQGIKQNKKVFAGLGYSLSKEDKDKFKEICDSIIKSASEENQTFLKDHLKRLFPKLGIVYGDFFQNTDPHLLWTKNRRICSEIFFDRYFKFSLSDEEISQNDIKLLLAHGKNYEDLYIKAQEIDLSKKSLNFLTIFPDHLDKIEKENIESFTTLLLDLGDSFPVEFSTSFIDVKIHALMNSLLIKLDSQDERYKVLKNSLKTANRSIIVIVIEMLKFRRDFDDIKEKVSMKELLLNSDQLNALEEIAKYKIDNWDKKGRLDKSNGLRYILDQWKIWGANKEDIDNVISRILLDDSRLVNFISDFVLTSYGGPVTDLISTIHYNSIDLRSIEAFVSLDKIEPIIRNIYYSETVEFRTEKEEKAVKMFLDTFEGEKIKDSVPEVL